MIERPPTPQSSISNHQSAMNHGYVNSVARKSGSNFYFSFFSLPREKREAITAVYAFCREVDDAVDAPGQKDPAAEVTRWREEIARTYDGSPSLPLTRSMAWAIERFDLTRAYFDGILDGVAMDLARTRYPTFENLSAYCYHVAGEVGLLCMEIFGYRSERLKDYAVKLGTAFQLTNILRDIKTDAERGRIYIPQEDLKRFGVEEEWIMRRATGSASPDGPPMAALGGDGMGQFRRLMAFEVSRARRFYRDASVLPTAQERPSLRAAEIMKAIYENVLDRIERRNYGVFDRRVRVPTPVKLWLAARAWWRCRS
jgi:phytoene synthase